MSSKDSRPSTIFANSATNPKPHTPHSPQSLTPNQIESSTIHEVAKQKSLREMMWNESKAGAEVKMLKKMISLDLTLPQVNSLVNKMEKAMKSSTEGQKVELKKLKESLMKAKLEKKL